MPSNVGIFAPMNSVLLRIRILTLGCTVLSCGLGELPSVVAQEENVPPGEIGATIYTRQCAECHGAKGEGSDDFYPEELIGDKSIGELADLIEETMPEYAPEECVGEEARLVAAYIHGAFYSEIAQARKAPARIEFSRLTVRQYEQAVADLLGRFESRGKWDERNGLQGEYFYARKFRREQKAFDRLDGRIDFDFGEDRPQHEEFSSEELNEKAKKNGDKFKDDKEFSIRWRGGVYAPETGLYEFIIETENGSRLFLNDNDDELIDAWVHSGEKKQHRALIRLLGGRTYPLTLECFRFKEKSGSISLKWKRPHHTEEVIPARFLSPQKFWPTFVVQTSFPPDDRSIGYERGNQISKAWVDATTSAALEVADWVNGNLAGLVDLRENENRDERVRQFCHQFVEQAFRRPLSSEEKQFYVDRQLERATSTHSGVKRVVLLTLKSPQFLYRETAAHKVNDFTAAAWLSFGMWDSLPDEKLVERATQQKLLQEKELRKQIQRMMGDRRTRAKLRVFLHQWMQLDHVQELSKSTEEFPHFNEDLISDLRSSLELAIEETVWSEGSDFRDLLLEDGFYVNERLADYYGIETEEDSPDFVRVDFESEHRAGVISHPYMMAALAYSDTTSPIHRGVFLARRLLGRRLKPPPEAVTPTPAELHPDWTTRKRVALQTQDSACMRCHGMINPLGFAFEEFDAVGRLREKERNNPIDATGTYITTAGREITFNGADQLAEFLAESPEVRSAFVEQLFQYMIKQPVRAFGDDELDRLSAFFAANEYNILTLLEEIMVSTTLNLQEAQGAPSYQVDADVAEQVSQHSPSE